LSGVLAERGIPPLFFIGVRASCNPISPVTSVGLMKSDLPDRGVDSAGQGLRHLTDRSASRVAANIRCRFPDSTAWSGIRWRPDQCQPRQCPWVVPGV